MKQMTEKKWELLLTQNPSNGDLCYIFRWGIEKYKKKAQKMLNDNKKIIDIIRER